MIFVEQYLLFFYESEVMWEGTLLMSSWYKRNKEVFFDVYNVKLDLNLNYWIFSEMGWLIVGVWIIIDNLE